MPTLIHCFKAWSTEKATSRAKAKLISNFNPVKDTAGKHFIMEEKAEIKAVKWPCISNLCDLSRKTGKKGQENLREFMNFYI